MILIHIVKINGVFRLISAHAAGNGAIFHDKSKPTQSGSTGSSFKNGRKQLHIDPNALKQQLERGDLSSISARLGNDMGNQLNSLLSDPQKMQQVLSQTNLQQLLQNLK